MTTGEFILAAGLIGTWIFGYLKFRQDRKKLNREEVQELIDILQQTKKELHAENIELRTEMQEMRAEMEEIRNQNEMMTKIFQGRDEDSVMFREKGNTAFEVIGKVYGDVQEIKEVTLDIQSTLKNNNITTKIK